MSFELHLGKHMEVREGTEDYGQAVSPECGEKDSLDARKGIDELHCLCK